MQLVLPLDGTHEAVPSSIGNKAYNLGRLAAGGFRVPPGVVVTSEAYDLFLAQPSLRSHLDRLMPTVRDRDNPATAQIAEELCAAIDGAQISRELYGELDKTLLATGVELAYMPVAVRSSPAASLPGQYRTLLNVAGGAAVVDALKGVWSSYWAPAAIAMRTYLSIPHYPVEFGVVILDMVAADVAGVLFTQNIEAANRDNQLVIEAVNGLAEGLLSGRHQPSRFFVDRTNYRVTEDTNSPRRGDLARVTPEDLRQLADVAMQVERWLGFPADIEWALKDGKLYLLQARTLGDTGDDSDIQPSRDDISYRPVAASAETIWTRYWADNFFRGHLSPLGYSCTIWHPEVMNHAMDKARGFRNLYQIPMFRYYRGHVYTNTDYLRARSQYQPGFLRTMELGNHFPESEREAIAAAPFRLVATLLGEARVALFQPNHTLVRNYRHFYKISERIQAELSHEIDNLHLDAASPAALLAYRLRLRRLAYQHETEYVGWSFEYKATLDALLGALLERWYGKEYQEVMNRLLRGLPEVLSVQVATDLWRLSRLIRARPEALRSLEVLAPDAVRSCIEQLESTDECRQAFEQFFARWGYRRDVIDLREPNWQEEPGSVIKALKATVHLNDDRSPTMELAKQVRQRTLATREVENVLRRQPGGLVKIFAFRAVLRYALRYATVRENQRLVADAISARYRPLVLAMGQNLRATGLVLSHEDVFFLTEPELVTLLTEGGDPAAVKRRVASRRLRFTRYHVLPPMFIGAESQERAESSSEIGEADRVLRGSPASGGRASGPVRKLSSLTSMGTLEAGDVLVTTAIDPGWAILFPLIGGLVTEIGGALSHGAILAREFGVPAVAGVNGVFSALEDGQLVTVDGYRGEVVIESNTPA